MDYSLLNPSRVKSIHIPAPNVPSYVSQNRKAFLLGGGAVLALLTLTVLAVSVSKHIQSDFRFPHCIVLVGGESSDNTDVEFYLSEPPKGRFEAWNMTTHRNYITAAAIKKCIFVVGGERRWSVYLNSTDVLCEQQKTWNQGPYLTSPRKGPAGAVLDGKMYVCGGDSDGHTRLSSCDVFDPNENTWHVTTPLQGNRDDAAAVALNGYLYVIGGYNKSHSQLNTVERYDPHSRTWNFVAPMSQKREHHAAAVLGNHIYVCGGYKNGPEGYLRACEKYDVESNSWVKIASMQTSRDDFALIEFDGKLYALGGENSGLLNTVEIYDPEEGVWQFGAELKSKRRYHAAVAV
jgi:N-acetylneuraminic acid mutarotase